MAKFEKGESGNPLGRPRGALSSAGRLRAAIADDLPQIITVLRERALSGDVQAAALLLSRSLAPLRPETPVQALNVDGQTLGARAESIIAAAITGSLSPSSAAELMSILTGHAKILETIELERRICALENTGEKQT